MRRSIKQLRAINYAIAYNNNQARIRAIDAAGLLPALKVYLKSEKTKYISDSLATANFCRSHRIDWRRFK